MLPTGGWFVQQNDARIADQRDRRRQLSLISTRIRFGRAVGVRHQLHVFQCPIYDLECDQINNNDSETGTNLLRPKHTDGI